MSIIPYILEQALRQLNLPKESIRQFQIASALSDVDGKGFPKELFSLSAPMITRGLLNYAILQMKRDWLYPYWVHKQLDPASESFVSRSQNPLLLNITHRNWTMIGSQHGLHEAIIDPRGLLTPLPREWSIDVWATAGNEMIFPSLHPHVSQYYDLDAPRITTTMSSGTLVLAMDAFTQTTRDDSDVVFNKTTIKNNGTANAEGWLYVAIRPFNPEGVAPIQRIEFRTSHHCYVNDVIGIAFSQDPDWLYCANAESGDAAEAARSTLLESNHSGQQRLSVQCPLGLANAFAGFRYALGPNEEYSVFYSTALRTEKELKAPKSNLSWRVSYDHRLQQHRRLWIQERSMGSQIQFVQPHVHNIYEANVLTLLQLHDKQFISPGPFLYHHFWFRDAAPMLHALDRLGYHKRVRQSINLFSEKLTQEGFFKGPDGEWDSNGAVLWLIHRHFMLSPSTLWLKNLYPVIRKAARWIIRKRAQSTDSATTHRGLMPKSLSAEHLGTVDQYYWDTFWSFAGLKAAAHLAQSIGEDQDYKYFTAQCTLFANDIQNSLRRTAHRLEQPVIPASPSRPFDEGAIGSIAGIYPLAIHDLAEQQFLATLELFDSKYVGQKGFYHPLIHSGYNPYLTMQLAHSYFHYGNVRRAWEIAETIFRQSPSPYSLPEAIHPRTGGGAMGDGHHGWAAAEIILFLLDSIIHEDERGVHLFQWCHETFLKQNTPLDFVNLKSSIGTIDLHIEKENERLLWCTLNAAESHIHEKKNILLYLPFEVKHVTASITNRCIETQRTKGTTILRCLPGYFTLKIEM